MVSLARRERSALADLALEVGPDAPTLCEGWTTRDLLAHVVVRESSPVGSPGIVIGALSSLTDREMARVGGWDYADLVERVRRPARWSPSSLGAVDAVANRLELFVHHEDVRRARSGWVARDLTRADEDALWQQLTLVAKMVFRRAGVPVTLRRTDTEARAVLVKGDGVEIAGFPSELTLYCHGREPVDVALSGDPAAVVKLEGADRGV